MTDLTLKDVQMALKQIRACDFPACTCYFYKDKNLSGVCEKCGIMYFGDVDYENIKAFARGELERYRR